MGHLSLRGLLNGCWFSSAVSSLCLISWCGGLGYVATTISSCWSIGVGVESWIVIGIDTKIFGAWFGVDS